MRQGRDHTCPPADPEAKRETMPDYFEPDPDGGRRLARHIALTWAVAVTLMVGAFCAAEIWLAKIINGLLVDALTPGR
jgi:hypothetical protein